MTEPTGARDGPAIFTFDSFEDALDSMARATAHANERLADAQRAVTYGDHWVRFWTPPIVIYGYVQTLDEIEAAERACATPEEPLMAGEIEHLMRRTHELHDDGYMRGIAYSTIEPDGEYGDTHRANLWPIDRATFNAARAARWDSAELDDRTKQTLAIIFGRWRQHTQAQ